MNNISATTVLRDTFGQRHLLSAVMAVMIMLISMPAQSEPEEGKGNQQDAKMQAFQEAREHLREVQQQLDEIQQKTMEAYPELKEKENNFRDLLFSIMRDKGYTPEEDMKRLQELRTQLQEEEVADKKRKELIREFQKTNMDLQRAQRSAFRNKKIQEVRSELQESMVKAMTKEYPETEKLLKELEETQKKMVELRRSGNQ